MLEIDITNSRGHVLSTIRVHMEETQKQVDALDGAIVEAMAVKFNLCECDGCNEYLNASGLHETKRPADGMPMLYCSKCRAENS